MLFVSNRLLKNDTISMTPNLETPRFYILEFILCFKKKIEK